MSDGTRTRDRLDHNQELYQLSYAHQAARNLAVVHSALGSQDLVAVVRRPVGAAAVHVVEAVLLRELA